MGADFLWLFAIPAAVVFAVVVGGPLGMGREYELIEISSRSITFMVKSPGSEPEVKTRYLPMSFQLMEVMPLSELEWITKQQRKDLDRRKEERQRRRGEQAERWENLQHDAEASDE